MIRICVRRRWTLTPLIALTLSGCVASAAGAPFEGIRPSGPNGYRVVLYRPDAFTNKAAYPTVFVDDVEKGTLRNGGFLELDLAPGAHKIRLERRMTWSGAQVLEVSLENGTTAFYRIGSAVTDIRALGPAIAVTKEISIQRVTNDLALSDLKTLKASQ